MKLRSIVALAAFVALSACAQAQFKPGVLVCWSGSGVSSTERAFDVTATPTGDISFYEDESGLAVVTTGDCLVNIGQSLVPESRTGPLFTVLCISPSGDTVYYEQVIYALIEHGLTTWVESGSYDTYLSTLSCRVSDTK